jgi:hypothetical protein
MVTLEDRQVEQPASPPPISYRVWYCGACRKLLKSEIAHPRACKCKHPILPMRSTLIHDYRTVRD